jgi:hypothetical protein
MCTDRQTIAHVHWQLYNAWRCISSLKLHLLRYGHTHTSSQLLTGVSMTGIHMALLSFPTDCMQPQSRARELT